MIMKNKVLLIEDNEKNRYLITFLLEKGGLKVIQAVNGKEGIDKALNEMPDLILLDIQLPEINGYEVAKHLKTDKKTVEIPIIAVTSYAMKGDREKTLEAGCTGYIEKPIDPDRFLDQITAYLKHGLQ
jgi:CheY-like chemotaxis protein